MFDKLEELHNYPTYQSGVLRMVKGKQSEHDEEVKEVFAYKSAKTYTSHTLGYNRETTIHAVLYPGYEKTFKKIVDERDKIITNIHQYEHLYSSPKTPARQANSYYPGRKLQPPVHKMNLLGGPIFVCPPTKYFSEDDLIEAHVRMFKEIIEVGKSYTYGRETITRLVEIVEEKQKISQHVSEILSAFLKQYDSYSPMDVFDQRELHRILSLMYFVERTEDVEKTTYGEFCQANKEELLQDVLHLNFSKITEDQSDTVLKLLRKQTLLYFVDRSLKKNQELINTLTVSEVKELLNSNKSFSPNVYTKTLTETVKEIRAASQYYSLDEMTTKLLNILPERMVQHSADTGEEIEETLIDKILAAAAIISVFIKAGVSPNLKNKTTIVKFLENHADSLTTLNIIMCLNVEISRNLIRSGDVDKVLQVMATAIEYYDEPQHFFRLLTETFLNPDEYKASFTEWLEYIKNSEKDDEFSMPRSFLIQLIAKKELTEVFISSNVEELVAAWKCYAVAEDLIQS